MSDRARNLATKIAIEKRCMAEELTAKQAERDELSVWLTTLECGPAADIEAAAMVRGQLERVLRDIGRLQSGEG